METILVSAQFSSAGESGTSCRPSSSSAEIGAHELSAHGTLFSAPFAFAEKEALELDRAHITSPSSANTESKDWSSASNTDGRESVSIPVKLSVSRLTCAEAEAKS